MDMSSQFVSETTSINETYTQLSDTTPINSPFSKSINSEANFGVNIKNTKFINNVTSAVIFRKGPYDIVSNVGNKHHFGESKHKNLDVGTLSEYIPDFPYQISHFDLYPKIQQPSGSLNIQALKSYKIEMIGIPASIYQTNIHGYAFSIARVVIENGNVIMEYI